MQLTKNSYSIVSPIEQKMFVAKTKTSWMKKKQQAKFKRDLIYRFTARICTFHFERWLLSQVVTRNSVLDCLCFGPQKRSHSWMAPFNPWYKTISTKPKTIYWNGSISMVVEVMQWISHANRTRKWIQSIVCIHSHRSDEIFQRVRFVWMN